MKKLISVVLSILALLLDDKIQVYFGGYGAELNPLKCERYGCISGSRWVDLTNLSTQKKGTFEYTVAKGETYTLTVNTDFFSNWRKLLKRAVR